MRQNCWRCTAKGQEAMFTSHNEGNSNHEVKRSQSWCLHAGSGCPVCFQNLRPWKYLKCDCTETDQPNLSLKLALLGARCWISLTVPCCPGMQRDAGHFSSTFKENWVHLFVCAERVGVGLLMQLFRASGRTVSSRSLLMSTKPHRM